MGAEWRWYGFRPWHEAGHAAFSICFIICIISIIDERHSLRIMPNRVAARHGGDSDSTTACSLSELMKTPSFLPQTKDFLSPKPRISCIELSTHGSTYVNNLVASSCSQFLRSFGEDGTTMNACFEVQPYLRSPMWHRASFLVPASTNLGGSKDAA